MSIWNRIGDVASTVAKGVTSGATNIVKFGGEVVGGAAGAARMGWDIGTAPWNDAEQYNGFVNTLKNAWNKEDKNIIKPLASAGGAIMKVPGVQPTLERINYINQEYIREPLTTYNLVLGDLASGRFDSNNIFDPNAWRKELGKAYEGAQTISLGQAVLGYYRTAYDPKFNIYDPREREAAFKKSMWGKSLSGGLDLTAQLLGDVTLAAGKAAKLLKASELGTGVLKNADAVAKAAEDITKAQYGVKNRFTKVIDDFTKNDSIYAMNHPMVKSSDQPGLLAHLLGQSTDNDTTALILRTAAGDPVALDELALKRADMKDALAAARADLSSVDEYKLFAAPDGTGMIPFLNDNPGVIAEAEANYAALAKADENFAKMMELGKAGGTLTRTTGKLGQGVEDFIAEARSMRFYDKNVGKPNVEVFQPTPFHRLYQKISWAENERPAGVIDFNDADSYKEVVATLNRLRPTSAVKGTPSALKRIGVITDEQANDMLDKYMKASTPEARHIAVLNIEGQGLRAIAARYGIDEKTAEQFYNNYQGARTSALKSVKDRGFMVDTDGSILKVPQFESQSADYLPMMDFDLLNKLLKQNSSVIRTLAGGVTNPVMNSVDVLQDMFKAGALLRLGYTMRNGIDSQLRIFAALGAMTSLQHVGPGLKNFIYNTSRTPARLIDRYLPVNDGMTFRQVQQSARAVIDELNALKSKIAEAEAKLSLHPENAKLLTKVNTLRLLQEEKLAVYNHYTDVINRAGKVSPKKRVASGAYTVTSSDGNKYILDDAFGGPLGDMFRRIASSQNSFQRIVESNSDTLGRKLATKGFGIVKPTDPGYFEQWAQTLRQQFGNSAVINKLIATNSPEDVTRWLISSPEGRDLRRRLGIPSDEAAEHVTKVQGFLDNYLPASSGLRSKIKEVTAADLRSAFKDPTTLPTIHGHVLEEQILNRSTLRIREAINGIFHFLGTLPEDAWARHPVYAQFYRQEVKRRLDIVEAAKGAIVSVKDQQDIMAAAHRFALREMKQVLFNIERRTNLAAAMKYISPFFSAQENAYKTWLKLAAANPAIVNRGYNVWQAPNRAGMVYDQEGNVVPEGQTSGNDVIWLSIPKGLQKIPGLNSLTEMGIPKQSLDIMFQGGLDTLYNKGNPNAFSDFFPVGPYVAIPIGEIVQHKPSLEESFKWALPYGAPKNAISGLLPAWVNKAQIAKAGLDEGQFARTYDLIWATEQARAKRNGLPPVPEKKILEMTKDYWNMRVAANLIMPFAPRFDSPYKYYIKKSQEYQRQFGLNANAKFLADFPEFFAFTASTSRNPGRVNYSVNAVENIEKYSDLVSELYRIEPKLIGTIVNDKNGYKFSQAAYQYLYKKRISPASKETFLSAQDPILAQQANEAEKGWIIYSQFRDAIDEDLRKRGLTSIQQKGAEDLAAIKAAVIQKLSVATDNEGKPIYDEKTGTYKPSAWYNDYLDSDGSKTNRVVYGLSQILNNEQFMKDNKKSTTWKSIGIYFEFRKALAADLMKRQAKSIDAKSNADLRGLYDAVVRKLSEDDPLGFKPLYDRFLTQDLVVDKYLTPKEPK